MTRQFSRLSTIALAATAAVSLTACGGSDDTTTVTPSASSTASQAATSTTDNAAVTEEGALPTAEDLNAVLALATDPNAPVDQKVRTVQGGEQAPELFDTMAQLKAESGATFEVVPPVLEGYTPDSVLTLIKYTLPDQKPQTVDKVEFVHEDGTWKLAQFWACKLIEAAVAPEKVPPMCANEATASTPEPAPGQDLAPAPAPAAK